ncbi:MAG TPA: acyltransferase [Micromonosporaceae bacterium]|nr:acyltransferase [Micromonosporaceae bacterium]
MLRLPALDVLRAVGAMAVVGTHVGFYTGAFLNPTWGGFLGRLDVGVAIFFVLSGFLLFRPFAEAASRGGRRPGFGRYLWRRALRILPAYWLVVTAALVLLSQNRPAPFTDWLRYATLSQIYYPAWNRNGLSQTWSLATEAAFYLLLPLVVVVAIGRRWRPGRAFAVVAGSGLVVSAAWFAAVGTGHILSANYVTWLPTYALWFSAGMALAVVHVAARTHGADPRWRLLDELAAAPVTCLAVALGLFAIASTPVAGPRDLTPPTPGALATRVVLFCGVAVMIMIPAAFGPANRFKAGLGLAPARWLGAVSYGLFLWQLVVLEVIYDAQNRLPFSGDPVGTFGLALGVTLLLASLSYYLLERPIMRWGFRWNRRKPERRRQPHDGDREQAEELRAGSLASIGGGQPDHAGDDEESDRGPRLQHA